MEKQEMKERIKDYFVKFKEDKFTKVKTINCKHNIIWEGQQLENKFILTENSYSNELKMGLDYRHKNDVDSVFFTFSYTNSDDGYPGMTNIKMYLILDNNINIELSEGSGFDHLSKSSKVGDSYVKVYFETAQLSVSMTDFIAIANASKIEYSIRFGQGSLEGSFNKNDLILFKGFYNAAFDDDFETNLIFDTIFSVVYKVFISKGQTAAIEKYLELIGIDLLDSAEEFDKYFTNAEEFVEKLIDKIKQEKSSLYNDPIEKHFFCEDRFDGYLYTKSETEDLIKIDQIYWPKNIIDQFVLNDLKIGIKENKQGPSPSILIFPNAIVYKKIIKPVQINFSEIKQVETKKGIIDTTIKVDDGNSIHKIDIVNNNELAKFIASFLNSEMSKNHEKVNYIKSDNQMQEVLPKTNDSLITKYSISESDLKKLKEIETEKSKLGLFSIKKEKLKAESMRILKAYDVKFIDFGELLKEIKRTNFKFNE